LRERDLPAAHPAEAFDLGFPRGEVAYNGIGRGRDGVIHCAVSTHRLDAGARLFTFDPESSAVSPVADLDAALASSRPRAIPHGKVHVDLVAVGDAMLGAAHLGYYDPRAPVERPGSAPGHAPYPGGWFFSIEDRRVVPLAQAPAGEGIIAMTADPGRSMLYALTWPRGLLLALDLRSLTLRDHGPALGIGETGSRADGTWVRICRSLAVDPISGAVFWSDGAGRILRLAESSIEVVGAAPRPEMWRKIVWDADERAFYGVLWTSSALFRFDPASLACEEIAVLRAPGAPSGATATLALSLEEKTIHLLATGPGVLRAPRIQLASTTSYLTYDLCSSVTHAHGPLRLGDGRWITQAQSLLLADGAAYSVCWVEVAPGSPGAGEIRELRRHTPEYRARGYAEEMVLVRFAPRR
jgi:hypothetical protein